MHTHISLHTLTINTCNTGRNVYKGVQRPELTHFKIYSGDLCVCVIPFTLRII